MSNDISKPLSVAIEDGALVIRVGIETLRVAAETSNDPGMHEYEVTDDGGVFKHPKVVNAAEFARDIVRELEFEQEDGSTPVHLLLDAAMAAAADSGSAGILWWDDPDWTPPNA